MKITVIGCGRWGSFLADYLSNLGHAVTLYGREESPHMKRFLETRTNGLVTLSEKVKLSTSLMEAVGICPEKAAHPAEERDSRTEREENVDSSPEREGTNAQPEGEGSPAIVISVGSQNLRALCRELAALPLKNRILVLCMKGLEVGSGKRLSQIVEEELDPTNEVAVWLGPGHVQEFLRGVPNCMVIDSRDEEVKRRLVKEFSSATIRFYYGTDLIGNEIGAAAKNVIGIAAGMLDGLRLKSLKGALMSRGTREISRLIEVMGGNPYSAYGLCHLGDYEATVFSEFSQNRCFGECFVKKEPFESLAEGYYTVRALVDLGERYEVELPICRAVYRVLYENAAPEKELQGLFTRSLKQEF